MIIEMLNIIRIKGILKKGMLSLCNQCSCICRIDMQNRQLTSDLDTCSCNRHEPTYDVCHD